MVILQFGQIKVFSFCFALGVGMPKLRWSLWWRSELQVNMSKHAHLLLTL